MRFTFLALFYVSIIGGSCCSERKSVAGFGIQQGVAGYVMEVSGNQMPSPDIERPAPKPLKTRVYVFEVTNINQVERDDHSPFYRKVMTRLIDSVSSDKKGKFALKLPAGSYSLFTKVDGQYYSNSFDSKNNISPFTVEPNKVAEVNITISAKAAY